MKEKKKKRREWRSTIICLKPTLASPPILTWLVTCICHPQFIWSLTSKRLGMNIQVYILMEIPDPTQQSCLKPFLTSLSWSLLFLFWSICKTFLTPSTSQYVSCSTYQSNFLYFWFVNLTQVLSLPFYFLIEFMVTVSVLLINGFSLEIYSVPTTINQFHDSLSIINNIIGQSHGVSSILLTFSFLGEKSQGVKSTFLNWTQIAWYWLILFA